MKRHRCLIAAGILFGFWMNPPDSFAEISSLDWQVRKSAHFVVYYQMDSGIQPVDRLLNEAERYYDYITERFGFRRFEFWTWEKRCQIYLYTSTQGYHRDNGGPEWSLASAHIKDRVIKTYSDQQGFFSNILPHEMAHLIFREFVGYETELPLWLDEGIASVPEQKNINDLIFRARELYAKKEWIPIEELGQIRSEENLENPDIFYLESILIAVFLLEKYGRDKFVDFCRSLRDHRQWEWSLREVYGFNHLSELNQGLIQFLTLMDVQ